MCGLTYLAFVIGWYDFMPRMEWLHYWRDRETPYIAQLMLVRA